MKKTRAEEAENLLHSDHVLYEKDILAKKIEEIVDENAVEVNVYSWMNNGQPVSRAPLPFFMCCSPYSSRRAIVLLLYWLFGMCVHVRVCAD